jgi:tetraacyldisaccharide 4'-kinase
MRALSAVFGLLRILRSLVFRLGLRRIHQFSIPVIVVGNITVGGTGKTPLVIHLTEILKSAGYRPGVVSRGYGSDTRAGSRLVTAECGTSDVGDEPLLIQRRTGVPVVVGSDRVAGIERLLEDQEVNVIVSDDGLQHLKMGRDLEIVVVDGQRRFGNGRLLPAGPLREPTSRLESVDFVVVNNATDSSELSMALKGDILVRLNDRSECPLSGFAGRKVSAVAGIGNPERFFRQLEAANIEIDRHPFPDHHVFSPSDLAQFEQLTVIMTEKDAVKCSARSGQDWWVLPVEACLPSTFEADFLSRVEKIRN